MAARGSSAQAAKEFVITRLLDAPRRLVFKAWTEPERLKQWFGPKGLKTLECSMDLRPGGVYHYGMQAPGGPEMWGKWVFKEIVEPERLVFVNSFSDKDRGITRHPMSKSWPLETLSTITFEEKGTKTLLTIRWSPINATEEERRTFDGSHDSMNKGWGGTLEQLEAYLSHFELVLTRIIDAPRERVFRAWSEPDRIKQWFAPKPYSLLVERMDFRPGGAFKMGMRAPDGSTHFFSGTYGEIVPSEKLAWTGEFSNGPKGQIRTEAVFEDQGGKTKVTVRQSFSVITKETAPYLAGSTQGWGMTLDQLGEYATA